MNVPTLALASLHRRVWFTFRSICTSRIKQSTQSRRAEAPFSPLKVLMAGDGAEKPSTLQHITKPHSLTPDSCCNEGSFVLFVPL